MESASKASAIDTPIAELDIDITLVRRLLNDRATDLASIWMLFSSQKARQEAIAACANVSDATLQRAKGWAILFGVMLLDTGLVDHPRHAVMGARTLRRIAEDGE